MTAWPDRRIRVPSTVFGADRWGSQQTGLVRGPWRATFGDRGACALCPAAGSSLYKRRKAVPAAALTGWVRLCASRAGWGR